MELLNSKLEKVMKSSGLDMWSNFDKYKMDLKRDGGEKIFLELEVILTICHQEVYETTEYVDL